MSADAVPVFQVDAKLRELILYMAVKSEGDEHFGAVKLNKLLFFSDFDAYRVRQKPITGTTYIKQERGPMVRDYSSIIKTLESENVLAVRKEELGGYKLNRPLALRSPDLTLFTADELDVVNKMLEEYRSMTTTEVSELSHRTAAWSAAEMLEEIPYEVALVSRTRPTHASVQNALETIFQKAA